MIGAGISGAAAAKTLVEKGFNVTVVEGRNRVGGRINTNYRGMSVPVEQGAHWIHGIKGNPIVNLAKNYKVNSTLSDYDNM